MVSELSAEHQLLRCESQTGSGRVLRLPGGFQETEDWLDPRERRRLHLTEPGEVLELGAVGEAVRHEDVLVEVVGAGGTVTLHFVNHLADRKDGGRGGGGGVGLDL